METLIPYFKRIPPKEIEDLVNDIMGQAKVCMSIRELRDEAHDKYIPNSLPSERPFTKEDIEAYSLISERCNSIVSNIQHSIMKRICRTINENQAR